MAKESLFLMLDPDDKRWLQERSRKRRMWMADIVRQLIRRERKSLERKEATR